MQRIFKVTLTLLACLSLSACHNADEEGTDELVKLRGYRNLTAQTADKGEIGEIRYMGLRNAAMSLGARAALAFRSNKINALLLKNGNALDRVFNFEPLVLEHNVLPPVLIEGRNKLSQNSTDTLSLADRTYTIVEQARFITTTPNWRDYLLMHYMQPELPDKSLLPKNGKESDIWDYYVQEGWIAGIEQADVIFEQNLAKLKRDLNGMIKYMTLLAQNMVTKPYIAKTNLGVTGDKSSMTVNKRLLRITSLPELKTNMSEQWDAEVVPEKNSE